MLAGGLVAAAMLPEPDGESRATRYLTTIKRMQKIDEATLKHMMAAEGRRPCPASAEYYPSHAQFGREDGSSGDCSDSGATDGIITPFDDANIVGGTVPVIDLHLPPEYYFDGWGRPFTYVVDKRATDPLECVQTVGGGEVEIYPTDGGTLKDKSFYTIISHGPDGYGAFQPGSGTRANRMNTGSTDADQLNNTGSSGFSGFDNTGPNPSYFVNEWISKETTTTYDDVTHYSEKYKDACCVGNKCSVSIAMLPPPGPEIPAMVANGNASNGNSGTNVLVADVNKDGYGDLVISETVTDSAKGRTNIVYGKETGWSNQTTLGVSGNNFYRGRANLDYSSSALGAGDLNNDGYADLIIGAREADPGGDSAAGEAYLVYGKSGWYGSDIINSMNFLYSVALLGISPNDQLGRDDAILSDVNGDGKDDVIISASRASPGGVNLAGEVYVVFADTITGVSTVDLSTLNGTTGFSIAGQTTSDFLGRALASGNFNGNDEQDVVISAGGDNKIHVIFGQASGWGSSFDLATIDGTNGFTIPSSSISAVDLAMGDINGDGLDDIVIGASLQTAGGNSAAGNTYVIFGESPWSGGSSFLLSSLDGSNGFILEGISADDRSGTAVSVQDVNGDGYGDIISSAYQADPNAVSNSGQVYVVFGKASGWDASMSYSALDGTNGFIINGEASMEYFGIAVGGGDMNGDGFDDIAIGAMYASPPSKSYAGKTYVVFGNSTDSWSASHNIADLLSP